MEEIKKIIIPSFIIEFFNPENVRDTTFKELIKRTMSLEKSIGKPYRDLTYILTE